MSQLINGIERTTRIFLETINDRGGPQLSVMNVRK